MSLSCYTWGTTIDESLINFPCDSIVQDFDDIYNRGITIDSSKEIIFRWLCQLRVANYAFGKKDSPDVISGLEHLAIGQSVMEFFEIVSFDYNKHITIQIIKDTKESKIYGDVAVSYVIIPESKYKCRLLVRCRIKYSKIFGILLRFVLPWGDLIMMRRQLRNFKKLSEKK